MHQVLLLLLHIPAVSAEVPGHKLGQNDLLIITADHGNDPTYQGTDHTREYVPFLAYSPAMKGEGVLGIKESFATIGATLAENFNLKMPENTIGESVLNELVAL